MNMVVDQRIIHQADSPGLARYEKKFYAFFHRWNMLQKQSINQLNGMELPKIVINFGYRDAQLHS